MADSTIQLRIANRAIALWWFLILIGLITFFLPGLWVNALGLSGLTYADFELIRLGGAGVGALGLLRALHLKLSASYTVTSDSVTAKQGVFSRRTDYVRSNHIEVLFQGVAGQAHANMAAKRSRTRRKPGLEASVRYRDQGWFDG